MEYLTKWVTERPLKTKAAVDVTELIVNIVARFGVMSVLVSGQGPELRNKLLRKKFCDKLGFEHRLSTPHHPQKRGLTENVAQTFKSTFSGLC